MKKTLIIIFVILFQCNTSYAYFGHYKCSLLEDKSITKNVAVTHWFDKNNLVFYSSDHGTNYIYFGRLINGDLHSYQATPDESYMIFHRFSKPQNDKMIMAFVLINSERLKKLDTKSIFDKKKFEDKIDYKISENELLKEIKNFETNWEFAQDLFNNRPEDVNREVYIFDEYSCEKTSRPKLKQ